MTLIVALVIISTSMVKIVVLFKKALGSAKA